LDLVATTAEALGTESADRVLLMTYARKIANKVTRAGGTQVRAQFLANRLSPQRESAAKHAVAREPRLWLYATLLNTLLWRSNSAVRETNMADLAPGTPHERSHLGSSDPRSNRLCFIEAICAVYVIRGTVARFS
jgi:hypothetical protein